MISPEPNLFPKSEVVESASLTSFTKTTLVRKQDYNGVYLLSPNKDDMPCSANADCKAAFISNWGTMLRVECTCQNLPPMEQALCKLFHHMLHSKSCFSELRQISITKKDFHWVNTEVPEEKLSRAQLHSSSINGETVYVIAYSSCIVLILGIVLLTLLKIR
ncbi:Gfral [Columba guinea]|nr:Gfral [Columba guinea]